MNEARIINLDDLANTVEIIVAKKPFKISRITMEIRTVYGKYLILSGEYLNKLTEVQNAPDSMPIEELTKLSEGLQEIVETYAIAKAEYIKKMIGLILKANGYEFDFEWWEQNSDYHMMEQFCVQALKKDETETQSKKKVTEN